MIGNSFSIKGVEVELPAHPISTSPQKCDYLPPTSYRESLREEGVEVEVLEEVLDDEEELIGVETGYNRSLEDRF
jgi:hypothetical protein